MAELPPPDVLAAIGQSPNEVLHALREGRVTDAERQAKALLRIRPRSSRAQNMMAVVHFVQGHFGRAAAVFEPLARRHEQISALHYNAGLAALYSDQLVKARDHLRRAAEIDPLHRRAYAYLAWIHLRRDETELAGAALLEAGLESLAKSIVYGERSSNHALTRQVGEAAYQLAADLSNSGTQNGEDYLEVVVSETAPDSTTADQDVPGVALNGTWSEVADGLLSSLLSHAEPISTAEQKDGLWILRLGDIAGVPGHEQMSLVRQSAIVAAVGRLELVPADLLTVEGEALPEFCACRGDGSVVLRSCQNERQVVVRLDSEELVVSPQRIVALAEDIRRAETSVPGLTTSMLRLSGRGNVLLSLPEHAKSWAVEDGLPVRIERARLVGFKGNLKVAVPKTMMLSRGGDLLCEGNGTILLATS